MAATPAEPRRSRRRLWAWAAFLAACGAFVVCKPAYDRHWRRQVLRADEAARQAQRARQLTRDAIWQRLFLMTGEPAATLEEGLGLPAGRLDAVPSRGRHSLEIPGEMLGPLRRAPRGDLMGGADAPAAPTTAPPDSTGWRVTLHFRDGVYTSARALPPPAAPVRRPLMASLNLADAAARLTLFVVPFVWLGGLLAAWAERRTRGRRFAEVALAAVVAGSAAWGVRRGTFTTVTGLTGWGTLAVMALVAAGAMRQLGRAARLRGHHRCHQCGYDLTGNVSGVCPECGTWTPQGTRRRQAEQAETVARAVAGVQSDEGRPDEGGPDAAGEGLVDGVDLSSESDRPDEPEEKGPGLAPHDVANQPDVPPAGADMTGITPR